MALLFEGLELQVSIGGRPLFRAERLQVRDRDRIGIVGMNGSGKTSLLRVIAEEIEPDEGSVKTTRSRVHIPQLKPDEGTLSGGETTTRYIERALAEHASLVLADEPTMHLDTDHIRALEERFITYDGGIIVVSHDRAFLDAVCTRIWAVEDGEVKLYNGNYSFYAEQRQLEKRQHWERYESYTDKRRQLEDAVRTKSQKAAGMMKVPKGSPTQESRKGRDYYGSKQKGVHQSIKALQTRIEKLEHVDKPRDPDRIKMDIPGAAQLGSRTVIRAERLEAHAGQRLLWSNVSFALRAGSKTALIGPNGSGKTTLIKRLLAGGDGVSRAPAARIGYFSQNLDIIRPERTIMDNVSETAVQPPEVVRTVLARLLFKRDDVYKPVGVLSGGERVRVSLAKLFVSDVNVLVMDEPTNFLDIPSIEAFESLLQEYEGTVLFVSHDRRFVERVADRLLDIREGRVDSFEGTLQQYREDEARRAGMGDADLEAELMTVETKLTETLGRLSMPRPGDDAAELNAAFKQLTAQRRELRERLGKS